MNKRISLFCLSMFFAVLGLRGQTQNCEITGAFNSKTTFKYAYLVNLKSKKIIFSPIVEDRFNFRVEKTKDYQTVYLFFELDSAKNYSYFSDQMKRISDNYRTIAIENADIIFEKDAKHVKVKTGKLNEDIVQMYIAMNSGNYDLFFDQHPDSPLTISILKALLTVNKMAELEKKYNCKALYEKLSERIKNSTEGKEILAKL